MPTELEELVEFLHHGNTQIRQIATENLVPFSKVQPDIFKADQLKPVKDLKVLVRDYAPIAKNALTILINISRDTEVLALLAEDDAFLETILSRVTNPKEPTANDLSTLLANLSKSPSISRLITLERSPISDLSPSKRAITQLIELFNRGANGTWNKDADYDYLAYVFADLAKYPPFTAYLTTPPPNTPLDPLTLFLPHTSSPSPTRRLGTASLLKNLALLHPDIPYLLSPASSILPPLLLPLCSPSQPNITEQEMDVLPEECQYLTPSHRQESSIEILGILLETILVLCTRGGRPAARMVRERGTYPVIRELHLQVEDEGVRRGCERIVDVIMGDDIQGAAADTIQHDGVGGGQSRVIEAVDDNDSIAAAAPGAAAGNGTTPTQKPFEADSDDSDDDKIVPIF